jgi:hypothetical protein
MNLLFTPDNKKDFDKNGYLVIDLMSEDEAETVNLIIAQRLKSSESTKKNPSIYHYNDSPRVIEAWRWSDEIKSITLRPSLLNLLETIWGEKPIPFSTINFLRGTEQPLHSDAFHFGSEPSGALAGVWIALENVTEGSGELVVVPGSHKLPYVDCGDLGLDLPTSKKHLKENNTVYEKYVESQLKKFEHEKKKFILKKGQAIIWHANLLHGSSKISNQAVTRKSMVIHYHFEGCKYFFNPNFSKRNEGKIAIRDLTDVDIRKN